MKGIESGQRREKTKMRDEEPSRTGGQRKKRKEKEKEKEKEKKKKKRKGKRTLSRAFFSKEYPVGRPALVLFIFFSLFLLFQKKEQQNKTKTTNPKIRILGFKKLFFKGRNTHKRILSVFFWMTSSQKKHLKKLSFHWDCVFFVANTQKETTKTTKTTKTKKQTNKQAITNSMAAQKDVVTFWKNQGYRYISFFLFLFLFSQVLTSFKGHVLVSSSSTKRKRFPFFFFSPSFSIPDLSPLFLLLSSFFLPPLGFDLQKKHNCFCFLAICPGVKERRERRREKRKRILSRLLLFADYFFGGGKGGVDPGETFEEGGLREMEEEIGLSPSVVNQVGDLSEVIIIAVITIALIDIFNYCCFEYCCDCGDG